MFRLSGEMHPIAIEMHIRSRASSAVGFPHMIFKSLAEVGVGKIFAAQFKTRDLVGPGLSGDHLVENFAGCFVGHLGGSIWRLLPMD